MKAAIIIIANEVLSGETLDTNSDFLCKQLYEDGVEVSIKITVADAADAITNAIDYCFQYCDFIVTTGGLGPTKDDITKKTLCDYFNDKLSLNEKVLSHIHEMLKYRYPTLSEAHRSQAYLPSKCTVLTNNKGTASGMVFRNNNKTLISLPGVPFEMKSIYTEELRPFLTDLIQHRVKSINIKTAGIGESVIAEKIKEIEENLPENIKMAYLPSIGQVKLRLTAMQYDDDFLIRMNEISQQITQKLEKYVYGSGNITLEKAIGDMLLNSKMSLSVAESCTGGYLSHLITSVPGSSQYYKGGMVVYSNEMKINQLGVDKQIIEEFGAVSAECAASMAVSIQTKTNSDVGIATTGIAGPSGATENKPLGLLFIAVSIKDKIFNHQLTFNRGREQNIIFFAVSALEFLRQILKSEKM